MEETCWKCKGSGVIERYKHIEDGKCFACGGDGKLSSSDRNAVSNDYADKGIKSGKLSHLLKVTPSHLTATKRSAWEIALRKAASEKLGEPVSDSYLTNILRNKMLKAENRDKSGMKKYDPKETKTHKGMKYAGLEIGVLQQDGDESSEIYTDGEEFFNKAGHQILSPLKPNENFTAETNTAKKLGDPKLEFMRNKIGEYTDKVSKKHGSDIGKKVDKHLNEIISSVERDFGGLVANTMFSDGAFESNEIEGAVGVYNVQANGINGVKQTYRLLLSGDFITDAVLMQEGKSEEEAKKTINGYKHSFRSTVVHELSHAYHQQALLNRDITLFAEPETSSYTPIGNSIVYMYEDKLLELESIGISEKKAKEFFFKYDGMDMDTLKKISTQFMGVYGATNFVEFYANNVEKLSHPELMKRMKEDYPDDYKLIKRTLRGVVDVEALYKNSN